MRPSPLGRDSTAGRRVTRRESTRSDHPAHVSEAAEGTSKATSSALKVSDATGGPRASRALEQASQIRSTTGSRNDCIGPDMSLRATLGSSSGCGWPLKGKGDRSADRATLPAEGLRGEGRGARRRNHLRVLRSRVVCLEVRYDKVERRIEISATVSEAVAKAFENAKDLPEEVSSVTTRDIAGARYVPPSDARIVERLRLAV